MNKQIVLGMGLAVCCAFLATAHAKEVLVDDFNRAATLYHGDGWETLNPGYWQIKDNALRRRLDNVGDHNPITSFPWHWRNKSDNVAPTSGERDPSLPFGMIWRRDWKLEGNYTIMMEATVRALLTREGASDWKRNQPGYNLMGLCFGGQTLYESRQGGGGTGAWMALWRDNETFGVYTHTSDAPAPAKAMERGAAALAPGDKIRIEVEVSGNDPEVAEVRARLGGKNAAVVSASKVDRAAFTNGYFGVVARGTLDFEINRVSIEPGKNQPRRVRLNELHSCYALGDTLQYDEGRWHCTMVALFRNEGGHVKIRVADSPNPAGGWENVPVAGSAPIVDNAWRRYTASIDVALPHSPAEKTLYYTVWKDGVDVTADPREGFLGRKTYAGRLPQLSAPYRVCGLGGHAIHGSGPNLPRAGKNEEYWVHDQPTPDAYQYFEDYGFQIIDWDDDVWYLELLFPPPSTDDAYKVVTLSICGPTTRWQMMRHWNVINPGDHDYGMDDVKGPEQMAVRKYDDLGQDPEYMRRNFKIVQHLISGNEHPSGTDNPKDWRRWNMPNQDFALVALNSRLWRTSQETDIWMDAGWGHKRNMYSRTDPTRTLLGEEQFAWLQQIIRTDPSPLICLTGMNCLQPIFTGANNEFAERDRVAADYAGWVKAGANRAIDLIGSRQGVVTVYGDIHLASIVRNKHNRFYECSFGPIGRSGSRGTKPGFGPEMTDYNGNEVQVKALYHAQYGSPSLEPREGPKHWNFLDMTFDPRGLDPKFSLKIRNIIDPPSEAPRGGGGIQESASNTGRRPSAELPQVKTLPNANVLITTLDGRPVRGVRSTASGTVPVRGLIDVQTRVPLVITANDGENVEAQIVESLPLLR